MWSGVKIGCCRDTRESSSGVDAFVYDVFFFDDENEVDVQEDLNKINISHQFFICFDFDLFFDSF
jgi:hypothetical protein